MKFISLLKKELRELLNFQMIIGMIVSLSMFMLIGSFIGDAVETASTGVGQITVADRDESDLTQYVITQLENIGYTVNVADASDGAPEEILTQLNVDSLLIFPEGFSDSILIDNESPQIELITKMKTTSAMGSVSLDKSAVISTINSIISERLMTEEFTIPADSLEFIQTPAALKEITVVDNNSAEISASVIASLASSQGTIVPIVIFLLVMFASQMIVSAISHEKIDKTLETLLSAPVSRISVLTAKMLAAAIVALINAVVYMIGFSSYMGGVLGTSMDSEMINSAGEIITLSQIMSDLGLTLSIGGYILLGLQMFMTIMIALSVSLILGALVTDAKSAQSILMPVMFSAMIPYMITILTDINTLSPVIKVIIYAIPFTHTFTAINNIMFGNWDIFWFGLIYQFIFFIVCMFFAVKIFTSDKIFTMSLNFSQKAKLNHAKKESGKF